MKKFLSILFLAFALIFVTGVSCEDPKPACEQDNTCTVTIKNNTSISLWVDCTEGSDEYNAERRIMPGSSTTYTVSAGSLTVWAASDANRNANKWNYSDINVDACEAFTFTWNSGKGAEGVSFNDDENYGFPKRK
jgi:hypothetical protein